MEPPRPALLARFGIRPDVRRRFTFAFVVVRTDAGWRLGLLEQWVRTPEGPWCAYIKWANGKDGSECYVYDPEAIRLVPNDPSLVAAIAAALHRERAGRR